VEQKEENAARRTRFITSINYYSILPSPLLYVGLSRFTDVDFGHYLCKLCLIEDVHVFYCYEKLITN